MSSSAPGIAKPRVLAAAVAVAVYWLVVFLIRFGSPGQMSEFTVRLYGTLVLAVFVGVWWTFFSRFTRRTRVAVLTLMALIGGVATALAHPSLTTIGAIVYVLPYVATAWALAAAIMVWVRRASLAGLAIVIGVAACAGVTCLLRFDGIYSGLTAQTSWRWTPSQEEVFLASHADSAALPEESTLTAPPLESGPGDWTEFRGPRRDGTLPGVRIATDWDENPPTLAWKQRIGPGWSSFIVVGDRAFTQEQRSGDEAVTCYEAATGREIWASLEQARFENPVSGVGPRGTPTFDGGRLYAFGATGLLRCIEARTGKRIWIRDVRADAGAELPMYGYAGSPLVADGLATVIVGGPEGKSVIACRLDDGQPVWMAGEGTKSYSSVQREEFDGVIQYLCSSDAGVTSIDPASGRALWSHAWPVENQYRIVQPRRLDGRRLLIGTGLNYGLRLLDVKRIGKGWSVDEVWTDNSFKPYFSDFVIVRDTVFGFDGSLLSAFRLDSPKRLWKRRGFDSGQVLLLADQELLVVATEEGKVSLMTADPKLPKVLGTFQALAGKTWNHPVIAHGRLFLRNSEEAACYVLRGAAE